MAFAEAGGYELEALAAEPQGAAQLQFSAQAEDLYWARNYWKQPYFRPDYDYEDYAPAYCVGYSGCAQYGGRFEDAEKSLCANFVRIKGDSRLTWEEAIEPIRSAWARLEASATAGDLIQRVSEPVAA
jgi:hypothetical protein